MYVVAAQKVFSMNGFALPEYFLLYKNSTFIIAGIACFANAKRL